jgi:hypothetical protein
VLHNITYSLGRLRRSAGSPEDVEFDKRYGTETAGIREIGSLRIDSPNAAHAVRSQTTGSAVFNRALDAIPADVSEFCFVDYGCGKGKLLLLASLRPFRRIAGVEFAEELAAIAERNIGIFRAAAQVSADFRVWRGDAAQFDPPPEPLVCYFYNPFRLPVMTQVEAQLRRSLAARPRPVFIVYVQPSHREAWDTGAWETIASTEEFVILRGVVRA